MGAKLGDIHDDSDDERVSLTGVNVDVRTDKILKSYAPKQHEELQKKKERDTVYDNFLLINRDGKDVITRNVDIAIDMYDKLRQDGQFMGTERPSNVTEEWQKEHPGELPFTTKREKLARQELKNNKSAKAMAKLVAHGLYPINKQPDVVRPQYHYNRFMQTVNTTFGEQYKQKFRNTIQ